MADVPHFDLPFRFSQGRAVEVEQDSIDDVAACVEAALRTRPHERDEHPEFGTPDLTFSQLPLSTDALVATVEKSEPRARLLAEVAPDRLDETVARVRLTIAQEG